MCYTRTSHLYYYYKLKVIRNLSQLKYWSLLLLDSFFLCHFIRENSDNLINSMTYKAFCLEKWHKLTYFTFYHKFCLVLTTQKCMFHKIDMSFGFVASTLKSNWIRNVWFNPQLWIKLTTVKVKTLIFRVTLFSRGDDSR